MTVMKVSAPKINQHIATSLERFSQNGGEKISNYVNAAGKAVIAPFVIMNNPFTHKDEKDREWASVKQPVEAVITLAMQLAALSVLYKSVDSLIKRGKISFKSIENAAKDASLIPEKFLKACNNNKDQAIKMYKAQCNEILKDRLGAVVSMFTYVPVLAVSNRVFPKIAQKLVNKDENKSDK